MKILAILLTVLLCAGCAISPGHVSVSTYYDHYPNSHYYYHRGYYHYSHSYYPRYYTRIVYNRHHLYHRKGKNKH